MLVFLNAFTNKIDATATKPETMSDARFAQIEAACRAGLACHVAADIADILRAQPHPHCFLVVNP